MSWGLDLWDQYDCVGKHTEKGIDFLEKYAQFLKKRVDIETGYANELKKLVKNFQPRKKEEDDNQFSWFRAFQDMLKEVHDMAGQHEVIAENTQTQLIMDVQKCVSELKTDRKKFLTDGTKVQNQMKESLKQLENAKKNYEKRFSDSERALDSYRRADADINLSRAEVEKTRMTSQKRVQEAEDSKNEYASFLQNTNKFQNDYYTVHMPTIFKSLQDLDERRIRQIQTVINTSATIEQNILPIVKTCIDGMTKAAQSVNIEEDSRVVIERYRTGFPIPGPIPFEDLSNGLNGQPSNPKPNSTPDPRVTRTMSSNKSGTVGGGKKKNRGGLFKIFGGTNTDEQKEDFSNIPPAQRKAKLLKKIDEIRAKVAHETAEREGMIKMKEVYETNPALGDPNSIVKKLEQNATKLNEYQSEMKKYQDFLADAESEMTGSMGGRHGSDDSMTHSITSESSVGNPQVSAPGTPATMHGLQQQDEYYEPVQDPEEFTPVDDGFQEEFQIIGTCRALYPFDAVNEGSVSMVENEEMWVLEQDQGDGWTRVRKNDNSEGFVPTSYIQCHFYDQDAV